MGAAEHAPVKLLPLLEHERIASIDVVRGAALLGVLLINLESDFRVLSARAANSFHTDPGLLNYVVDWILDIFVGGKAMSAFSFLFGVGLAMQAERASERATGRGLLRAAPQSYADILRFRLQETPRLMLPIYAILLPRTLGLFLLGMLAHRRGLFRRPEEYRRLLRFVLAGGIVVASVGTSLRALDTLGVLTLGRMRNPGRRPFPRAARARLRRRVAALFMSRARSRTDGL
jgi:uncharacterized membrane protein YeiB